VAELLIKAVDHTHPDPVVDRQGAYKRGMIVRVEEDGFQWGTKEGLPKFVLVKITGLAAKKVRGLVSPQDEDDIGVSQDPAQPFRRRRWRLLVDNIPNAIKIKLRDEGEVTVTKTQIRNYLRRIRDNAQYTGMD